MRVVAVIALVAIFALVAVEARAISRLSKSLSQGATNPLSYGFACAGKTDNTCCCGATCQADSGKPPQKATGFICLFPGEGDMETAVPEAVKTAEASQAASLCPATSFRSKKTLEVCECEAQCNDGFVCGVPKAGKDQNVCRPPPALPTTFNPSVATVGEGAACSKDTPCSVGLCMSKYAYLCRQSTGKDVGSCTHIAKSTDKLSCHIVAEAPKAVPAPAATCSKKGEYTFWMGPNGAAGVDGDKDARGFLADGKTLFLPCCAAQTIAAPSTFIGQYGVVVGKVAVCGI